MIKARVKAQAEGVACSIPADLKLHWLPAQGKGTSSAVILCKLVGIGWLMSRMRLLA